MSLICGFARERYPFLLTFGVFVCPKKEFKAMLWYQIGGMK
jgi:hypothetical protein